MSASHMQKLPGGFHKQPRTLQQNLKSLGINETEKSLHLEYYAAFDFESILMGSTLENTNKTLHNITFPLASVLPATFQDTLIPNAS